MVAVSFDASPLICEKLPSSSLYSAIESENADVVKGACIDIDNEGNELSAIEKPGREAIIENNEEYIYYSVIKGDNY